jgi:hypothetical protein
MEDESMTAKIPITVLTIILNEIGKSLPMEVTAKAEFSFDDETLQSFRELIKQLPDDQFKAWALNELKDVTNGSQPTQ